MQCRPAWLESIDPRTKLRIAKSNQHTTVCVEKQAREFAAALRAGLKTRSHVLPFVGRGFSPAVSCQRKGTALHAEGHCRKDHADDHHGLAAAPELVYGKPGHALVSGRDGAVAVPRAVCRCPVGVSAGAGGGRARHRDRRRLPVRRRHRRAELDQLSAAPHERVRHAAPEAGEDERGRAAVPARAHPARLPRSAGDAEDHRTDRPRRDAVCGDLEGGAAADAEAGEVRDGDAGAGGVRGAGRALQGHPGTHLGDVGRVQRGAARPGGRGLPGDPDGRAADPPAGGARHRGRGDQPGVHAEGVQQHREGAAGEDGSVVPHVLGQPVAAADVRECADLQAGAEAAEPGGRGRDHVRDDQLGGAGPGGRGAGDHGHEGGDRGDRPSHAAGGVAGGDRGPGAQGAEGDSAGAAGAVVGLRDGARGDEPAARVLQDGGAGAGHEHREEGAGAAGDRIARRRPEALPDPLQP